MADLPRLHRPSRTHTRLRCVQGQCQTVPRMKIHVSDLFIRSCVEHVQGYSAGNHEKPVVLTQKVVDFNQSPTPIQPVISWQRVLSFHISPHCHSERSEESLFAPL